MVDKVILVGYMASGKSTVAKILAENMHIKALDLDVLIEEREKMTINNIFKTKGELYFRKVEHVIFKEIVNSDDAFVISTGGGTPCYAQNHLLLQNKDVSSFYLQTALDVLYGRLLTSKCERPLLAMIEKDELHEFIAKHLFERSYFYHHAKHILKTENHNPAQIARLIEKLL
uniref:shikimate kinase n=1 Tax=Flavobacterium sp. TaxID=239 RepID=UPI00404A8ADE